jgi:hypothetical protein
MAHMESDKKNKVTRFFDQITNATELG